MFIARLLLNHYLNKSAPRERKTTPIIAEKEAEPLHLSASQVSQEVIV